MKLKLIACATIEDLGSFEILLIVFKKLRKKKYSVYQVQTALSARMSVYFFKTQKLTQNPTNKGGGNKNDDEVPTEPPHSNER